MMNIRSRNIQNFYFHVFGAMEMSDQSGNGMMSSFRMMLTSILTKMVEIYSVMNCFIN